MVGFIGFFIAEANDLNWLSSIFIGVNVFSTLSLVSFLAHFVYYKYNWRYRPIVPYLWIIFILMLTAISFGSASMRHSIEVPTVLHQILGGAIVVLALIIAFISWQIRKRIRMDELENDE